MCHTKNKILLALITTIVREEVIQHILPMAATSYFDSLKGFNDLFDPHFEL